VTIEFGLANKLDVFLA